MDPETTLYLLGLIKRYDAGYRGLLTEYLEREGVASSLLSSERFADAFRVTQFYRYFVNATIAFRTSAEQVASGTYNPLLITADAGHRASARLTHLANPWMEYQTVQLYASDAEMVHATGSGFVAPAAASFLTRPPRLLLRAQAVRTTSLLSPMARHLVAPSPQMHIAILGRDDELVDGYIQSEQAMRRTLPEAAAAGAIPRMSDMASFTLNLSINLRVGASALLPHLSAQGRPVVVATPYHLALATGPRSIPWAVEAARQYGIDLCSRLLPALSPARARSLVAHLTDYELPVPVSWPYFMQDIVPNPFLSTTSSLRTALLYASGLFRTFDDKYTPRWDSIARACRDLPIDRGIVYLIRSARPALPVGAIADAATIGTVEAEYAMPGGVLGDEIEAAIPACELLKCLSSEQCEKLFAQAPSDDASDDDERFISPELIRRYAWSA